MASGTGAPTAHVALPLPKHHTVVVWHWATKGNLGSEEPDFMRLDCLACLRSSQPQEQHTGRRPLEGRWEDWEAQVEICLAELIWTTSLGLHLVYTWSTLGLHAATMSHDYVLCMNTKQPKAKHFSRPAAGACCCKIV